MSIDLAADRRWRAILAQSPTLIQRGDSYGLERESLRVLDDGSLALTPHPAALGSSLTNKFITTDFSESQIEFTTSPYRSHEGLLRELRYLQLFTLEALAASESNRFGEGLWPLSMPSRLPAEEQIPIAWYGESHTGLTKHIYRQGLARRYGRRMQTVSGVHFNFSFSRRFFRALADALPSKDRPDPAAGELELQNQLYFAMIRNFQRESVYLMYLFGASPAIDASFLLRPDDRLSPMDFDQSTLYAPFATSLRLSDIGYTNSNQCDLAISYDSLPDYIQTMCQAVSSRNPAYSKWSFERGEQLNDYHLQIENEHYGVIRPKQTPQVGERPLTALEARGVRYLEVRCLDVDPYDPGGVSEERMAFVHLVLLNNLLNDSPPLSRDDCSLQRENQKQVAWFGRDPKLRLKVSGTDAPAENFRAAGLRWVESLAGLAERLDREIDCDRYVKSLTAQLEKFKDAEQTPSARILDDMRAGRLGHIAFGLDLLDRHRRELREQSLPPAVRRKLEHAVRNSRAAHAAIESRAAAAEARLPEVCSGA
ncbi:MAG: glutamate--cysteine ligase [Leptospirales bacterium]|jgi:glutamate--cysteine ligase